MFYMLYTITVPLECKLQLQTLLVAHAQTPLPGPRDFSLFAEEYLFDPLLMQLCRCYGPLLTKVRQEALGLREQDGRIGGILLAGRGEGGGTAHFS